jgi:S-adenosylmethionine uptake transporter
MQSLWMLGAGLSFALMAALVKTLSNSYSPAEILFYRCAFSALLALVVIGSRGESVLTKQWPQHFKRAAFAAFAMGAWYYTLGVLPIAVSVTLNYTSPLFIGAVTAFLAFRSKRALEDWVLYAPLILGFVGVVLVLRPSAGVQQIGPALIGLLGGLSAAFAFLDVKRLIALGESEWRLVFYFSLYSSGFALLAMLFGDVHSHTVQGLVLLLLIGLLGTLGQWAVSRAYGHGSVLVSAALQYSGVIFAALLGTLVWGEAIGGVAWSGIAVVIVAGVVATASRKKVEARRVKS